MRRLWDAALDLIYPPTCCACGQPNRQPGFCTRCRTAITAPGSPLCSVCGAPFGTRGEADHCCARCLIRRPRFGRARACAIYDAADTAEHPLKVVLQRYKYSRDVSLAPALGSLLAERAPLPLSVYDLIVPVPLHPERLRWRGFNQALLLAKQLARMHALGLDPFSLERVRPTRPQVDLDEGERRRNVAGAFCVTRPERVRRRRILLLDDVYTTGATVNECSRILRQAGARSVDVLVLARAVLH
jgi:ComF family protein